MFLKIIYYKPHTCFKLPCMSGFRSAEYRPPTPQTPLLCCSLSHKPTNLVVNWSAASFPNYCRMQTKQTGRCGCSAVPSRWNKCLIACCADMLTQGTAADLLLLIEIPRLWLAYNNTYVHGLSIIDNGQRTKRTKIRVVSFLGLTTLGKSDS